MVTITFEKPRDVETKIRMIKALRESTTLGSDAASFAAEAGKIEVGEADAIDILRELSAAGIATFGANGPPAKRRPYSGPSRAERLTRYRAAALTCLLSSALTHETFEREGRSGMTFGEFVAEQAEKYAQRAFAAERKPVKATDPRVTALCKAAHAAVNGIEPQAASVDDLLCDLMRAVAAVEDATTPV